MAEGSIALDLLDAVSEVDVEERKWGVLVDLHG
jgi:hypothetical protein